MKEVLSISEILGSKEVARDTYKLCATALATYDEGHSRLKVDLDSFVEKIDSRSHTERLRKDGLPPKQTVEECVAIGDATAAAKEIFSTWVKRVRQANPGITNV